MIEQFGEAFAGIFVRFDTPFLNDQIVLLKFGASKY